MAYSFQEIAILAFDIHTAADCLMTAGPDYYRPKFNFLAVAGEYNNLYHASARLDAEKMVVRAPRRRLLKNAFWKDYLGPNGQGAVDYWRLQAPLFCTPVLEPVALQLKGARLEAKVKVGIFLSALGWSTRVKILLTGNPIYNADLRDLMRRLRGISRDGLGREIPPDDLPFLVGGQPRSLSMLFKLGHDQVADRVYLSGRPPHSSMEIPRQILLGITKFQGEIKKFNALALGDLALLFGFLYGRNIELDEVASIRNQIMLTRFNRQNFALTDFKRGTLVFPQNYAAIPKERRKAHCMLLNTDATLMAALRLLHFYQRTQSSPPNTPAAVLGSHARDCLQQIPVMCKSPFCLNLFSNHKPLNNLLPEAINKSIDRDSGQGDL